MRKRIFLYFSIFIGIAALFLCAAQTVGAQRALRLHIVANSDSLEDQRVKLLVRSAVLNLERERMAGAADKQAARGIVMQDAAQILAAAEKTLAESGADYGARLGTGVYAFPTRSYGTWMYPAGEYTALRLVLGAGAGKNWWCVLFPPLCMIESRDGKIEYREDGRIRWKSLLTQEREGDKEHETQEQAMDRTAADAYDAVPAR